MGDKKELGWRVELVLTVQGPKEGAVIGSIVYKDTTREVAEGIQNKLAQLGIELNTVKNA